MRRNASRSALFLALSTSFIISLFLVLSTQDAESKGRPPPTPPPTFTPVLVYQRGQDLMVADETAQYFAVVHHLSGGWGGTAAWSPDGKRIVFVDVVTQTTTACSAAWGLFLLNVQDAMGGTGVPTCLVGLKGQNIEVNSPTWSIEGIIYSDRLTTNTADPWDLFWIDPDVGAPVNLTNTPDLNEESPSWSPIADQLVYVERGPGGEPSDLMVVDFQSEGGPLLGAPWSISESTPLQGVRYIDVPDWSNTSPTEILVLADNPDNSSREDLWLVDPSGVEGPINLTTGLSFAISLPSWSGDDSKIVLLTDVENTCGFRKKDVNGFILGIMPRSGVLTPSGCLTPFIGPPGTNTKVDFPRSLDWLPLP